MKVSTCNLSPPNRNYLDVCRCGQEPEVQQSASAAAAALDSDAQPPERPLARAPAAAAAAGPLEASAAKNAAALLQRRLQQREEADPVILPVADVPVVDANVTTKPCCGDDAFLEEHGIDATKLYPALLRWFLLLPPELSPCWNSTSRDCLVFGPAGLGVLIWHGLQKGAPPELLHFALLLGNQYAAFTAQGNRLEGAPRLNVSEARLVLMRMCLMSLTNRTVFPVEWSVPAPVF